MSRLLLLILIKRGVLTAEESEKLLPLIKENSKSSYYEAMNLLEDIFLKEVK